MMYNEYDLPEYPCKCDMWDILSAQSRPIMVYGMGNGADKLFERFEKYNISVSEVFASDGFVRGHSFRGFKVKSFSEIKENYSDFVIVLSFASNREDVIDMLAGINAQYDMYVPDMPVAGIHGYFDREFYNSNYESIVSAYHRLEDNVSRNTFAAVVNYKLYGRMDYLLGAYSSKDDMYKLFDCENIENIIDAGAYNGDTIREAKGYFANLKKVFAIEPDNRNFKKLLKYSEAEHEIDIKTVNSAAWCESGTGEFSDSGNRNSSISSTASYEHSKTNVSLIRPDDITDVRIDYIKYDVEGAEFEALVGSEGLISEYHPELLVSIYHRSRDLFHLVNYLGDKYPFYKMYIRRLKCLPAWELNLLLIDEGK